MMKTLHTLTLVFFLVSLTLVFSLSVKAQEKNSYYKDKWEETLPRLQLSLADSTLPKIILSSHVIYEYVMERGKLVMYNTEHSIVRVNSDEGIQGSNKIYIPLKDVIEITDIKARFVSSSGRQVLLDKNNIKEIKDDESANAYKIFAIEGVEKGGDIEYLYTRKVSPVYYGGEYFQYPAPVRYSSFTLITPENFIFKFKGYNNFPEIKDSVSNGKRFYYAEARNIDELKNEEFSNYQKNRMKVEYKLSQNLLSGTGELNNWSDIAQLEYKTMFTLSKKETKALEKYIKGLNIKKGASTEERIKTIENQVKNNILLNEKYGEENNELDQIIENRYGSKFGLVKLFANLFKAEGISQQLVLTSDRNMLPFDGEFESWRFLNNILFYFDETDQFLAPEEPVYRYGMLPFGLTYTDGLFIKPVKIGSFETAVPNVKFIPALDYTKTFNNLDIKIDFKENMESATFNIINSLGGYNAIYIQPYYPYIEDDKKKETLQKMIEGYTKDGKFVKIEAFNGEPNVSATEKPFEIHAIVEGSSLLENAGNKILFKIGELIGPQVEMYQEKERKMPVENDFNRVYDRQITFTIPPRYKVKNLNDLIMDVYYEKDSNRIFCFKSGYEKKDNVVTVKINEYYKEIGCPVEFFPQYRNVINASADFNKVTLVFEPEQ
jgi:hypothetical protein